MLVLLGCQSTPKQDYDVGYDFSQLKSFTIVDTHDAEDPFTSDRVKLDISNALQAQGFEQKANEGDFSVNFALKTEDKPQDSGLSIGLGTGSWGKHGGVGVGTSVGVPVGSNDEKLQTIQIDIIDPTENRLIWRGTDQYEFQQGGEKKATKTTETVIKILAQFPPQKSN
ncbi:DUF4136 domain-containing protein [Shewanella gaetbuli]|uniref:DUF4136 domain-containing protein n=1 Tax=Shewanella gaetbuli TaxID=220752 RepID=A0A9X1ZPX0_9GAMM|nr:DUF4136 domain-containing protein [Shewanella gaetbuli]MCL1141898.1 DUF4136 domain-containing protein [Shewanella gaetbuli]